MDILKNLYRGFRIAANEPAASQDDIDTLRRSARITVPEDYVNVVKEMTEVEMLINEREYLRIWPPLDCLDDYEYFQEHLPGSLFIGDNGNGDAIVYMTGKKGFGLYKVDFAVLDIEDAEFIAPSLKDLLTKGTGADVIF